MFGTWLLHCASTSGSQAGVIANCATCGRGSYCPGGNDKHGCPENQTTLLENASRIEECVCDEGRFATPDGCELCAAGSYKTEAGNHSCESCRIGTWSNTTGSRTEGDCNLCDRGSSTNASNSDSQELCIRPRPGQNFSYQLDLQEFSDAHFCVMKDAFGK